jgi:hypothetical protein
MKRCAICQAEIPGPTKRGRGRPPTYCGPACRERARLRARSLRPLEAAAEAWRERADRASSEAMRRIYERSESHVRGVIERAAASRVGRPPRKVASRMVKG